ncbi:SDR family NAD(P)-dependent oxidoreductase [Rhodococcus opacus]|uniref:SDR family NAD(P)-dependent oxidoreductase n=1 Tax=Rhodococcus opacus TaxID=37919 RepID=UPI0029494C80|nr:SDR family oxidoreductase [Rhodococcus opacus]MDV6247186.1 SDR family oxidoreductase [Rhodococcus opacus]
MTQPATNPRVLIGGGSGGIGAATARALAQDGWDVILTYRTNQDAAERVAKEIQELGRSAEIVQVDLNDHAGTAATVAAVGQVEPLSGVVYAAGPHIPMNYIANTEIARFTETINSDLVAAFALIRPALPQLRETGGAVLAVSTPAVTRFAKKDLLSAAPKAGVEQIIRGIASEEGRFGVRANCVAVGLLEGEGMWNELIERGDYTPEMLAAARRSIALRSFGHVSDVAEAAKFLMSPRAKWITGQVLAVDGGYSV